MGTDRLPVVARRRMRCLFGLAAIGLLLGAPAPAGSARSCGAADDLRLTGRDGHPLHLLRYRPSGGATAGIVLIHGWGMSARECWKDLPLALCEIGYEVLVPDLRGHGESLMPDTARASVPGPTRGDLALLAADASLWGKAFSDSVSRVLVAGVGWGGAIAARIVAGDRPLLGLIWLGPVGDAAAVDWQPRDPARRSLLLVASQEDAPSARVAEALYARFHATAELRLFSRGDGGCALLDAPGVRDGLLDWARQSAGPGIAP
jgi:pimeloyl-ACP methyl ester carboxylesterase